jgi:hypothetical protein
MNNVTAATIVTIIDVILLIGILLDVGPFKPVRPGLEFFWRALRAFLHDLTHRRPDPPLHRALSSDQIEELEIECYIGPYAEPFRADSLKAREALRRKRHAVRVVPPCELSDATEHLFAMNGRCVLCGGGRRETEANR